MSQYTIAQLVQLRFTISTFISEKTSEMKKSIESEKLKLDLVENSILEKLNELGVDKVTTEFGTASKDLKESFTMEDREVCFDWIKETDNWHFLSAAISTPNIKQYVKDNKGELPPGVKYSAFLRTKYRKPTKKPA